MHLFTFAILFITCAVTAVCGSPIVMTSDFGSSSLSKRFQHSTSDEPPELRPPQNMDLQVLIEAAKGFPVHRSVNREEGIAACNRRLEGDRLLGNRNDEVYLIHPFLGSQNPSLVRKIVVSGDPQSTIYKEKSLRVFRKIHIHNRLKNLIAWLRTASPPYTYYIVISYKGTPVPPNAVHDSWAPLDRMREDYDDQCFLAETDLGTIDEQDFVYLRRENRERNREHDADERNYEPLYV